MNTNINLLLHADEETLRKRKRIKTLNFIAIAFLVGVGAISLFIFLMIQAVNPSSIKKEQNAIIEKISRFQDKQIKLFVLNSRIGSVEKVLEKRIDLSKVLSGLLARMPSRLFIEDMEINDKAVVATVSSTSLLTIGELINNLADMVRKKEIISSLVLNTLVFDESKNSYQVALTAQF